MAEPVTRVSDAARGLREVGVLTRAERQRLLKIERTLRHAQATQRTEHDSWLNGYQDDVAWLVQRLRNRGLA